MPVEKYKIMGYNPKPPYCPLKQPPSPQTKVFAAAARAASSAKALPSREKEKHLLQTTNFLGSIVGFREICFDVFFFGAANEIDEKIG